MNHTNKQNTNTISLICYEVNNNMNRIHCNRSARPNSILFWLIFVVDVWQRSSPVFGPQSSHT